MEGIDRFDHIHMAIDEDHIGFAEVAARVAGLVERAEAVGVGSLVCSRCRVGMAVTDRLDQENIVIELGASSRYEYHPRV